ncbi:aminoglycoside 6-adenylyltransferase [Vagococcus sp. BWB3-3]|uniref:Aminoglycoside 6-adenylyltransferase n=1 Tax=Vagococcus allomyrinae TaxID=2794353 RepID=A0A940P8X4_9ENTE|nr:aminoglycoside 6-adenylyltransferase [Vagococcus allomyrinae]MBP1041821.1 aminoglycoside 6-adenylyltransferase [Vagococcus allomyrinae]
MRDEQTMMDLIIRFAEGNGMIRGAYLIGSRANKKAPRDRYQDYDIVYVVTNVRSFVEDKTWISFFGNLAIKEEPDNLDSLAGREVKHADYYMFLLLFEDGNRMDIKICHQSIVEAEIAEDDLVVKLLDKDGCLASIPSESSDRQFWVQAPSEGEFILACNDFWWCLQNVGKGIARQEFTYAIDMLETIVRPWLFQVLGWQVGSEHQFTVSIGKAGKFLPHFISATKWQLVLATYPRANQEDMWQSVAILMDLFSQEAQSVAASFGWTYKMTDELAIRNYLLNLKMK